MCGEHVSPSSLRRRSPGSSPHVRGAPGKGQPRVVRVGIIPACAGSTLAHTAVQPKPWDHPRMCGEHRIRFPAHDCNSGSSPHVRGARPSRFPRRRRIGIIPACAGSTPSETTSRWRYRDHPRMCGEHKIGVACIAGRMGSSPHVRGAHAAGDAHPYRGGIIPACAGSTLRKTIQQVNMRDHPRMCGEHVLGSRKPEAHEGSSPHVRGAPTQIHGHVVHIGIIPACAGRTPSTKAGWNLVEGSSPHVRGALKFNLDAKRELGIIPACAGSTVP